MATISPPSADACADELLDIIPTAMKLIRTRMREHSTALPSLVHFRALGFITRQPDADVSGVAAHIGMMLPSASKVAQTLLTRGYIARAADPHDRRRSLLRPTAKGRKVMTTARAATRDYLADLLTDCDGPTRAGIAASMQTLRALLVPPPATSAAKPGRAPRRPTTRTTAS